MEETQIREIARLNRSLGLGLGIIPLLEAVSGTEMPPIEKGKEQDNIIAYLKTFSHEQAGEVVQRLTMALKEQQAKAAEVSET